MERPPAKTFEAREDFIMNSEMPEQARSAKPRFGLDFSKSIKMIQLCIHFGQIHTYTKLFYYASFLHIQKLLTSIWE